MKKPTRKLAVRRETLRALADVELAHAAGGEILAHQTGAKNCLAASAQPLAG